MISNININLNSNSSLISFRFLCVEIDYNSTKPQNQKIVQKNYNLGQALFKKLANSKQYGQNGEPAINKVDVAPVEFKRKLYDLLVPLENLGLIYTTKEQIFYTGPQFKYFQFINRTARNYNFEGNKGQTLIKHFLNEQASIEDCEFYQPSDSNEEIQNNDCTNDEKINQSNAEEKQPCEKTQQNDNDDNNAIQQNQSLQDQQNVVSTSNQQQEQQWENNFIIDRNIELTYNEILKGCQNVINQKIAFEMKKCENDRNEQYIYLCNKLAQQQQNIIILENISINDIKIFQTSKTQQQDYNSSITEEKQYIIEFHECKGNQSRCLAHFVNDTNQNTFQNIIKFKLKNNKDIKQTFHKEILFAIVKEEIINLEQQLNTQYFLEDFRQYLSQ